MLNQFKNISCYEEFEIQCALTGVSKLRTLKKLGFKIDIYWCFISDNGIFNWFDKKGRHIEDPGVLKELKAEHIPLSISKCIIPNSVTHISNNAFVSRILLNEITIPNSITHIEDKAFYNCQSLKEVIIPDSVTHIGNEAFEFCNSLKKINIPDSVTSIGNNVFSFCRSLKKINIPDSVTSIGDNVFSACYALKEITIPDSVTSIGYKAFWFCESLKEIIFKGKTLDEVKQMENYPFGIEDEHVFKFS